MRSNNFIITISLTLMALTMAGCDSTSQNSINGTPKAKEMFSGNVGNEATFFEAAFNGEESSDDKIAIIDKYSSKILYLDVNEMSLAGYNSIPPLDGDKKVLIGKNGEYSVVIGKADFAIISRKGAETNPVELVGSIMGLAYNPDLHYLVLFDDVYSVAMMELDESGGVQRRWVGGPMLKEKNYFQNGTLLDNGDLLLLTTKNKLVKINWQATMDNEKWDYEFIEGPQEFSPEWMVESSEKQNLIIAYSREKISLFDLDNKAVTDEYSISDKTYVKAYYQTEPHFIVGTEENLGQGLVDVLYVDQGKLATATVRTNLPFNNISSSRLNRANDLVMFSSSAEISNFGKSSVTYNIFRARISDSLVTYSQTVTEAGRIALTDNYLFVQFDSPLGYIERRDYNRKNDNIKSLKGFNIVD